MVVAHTFDRALREVYPTSYNLPFVLDRPASGVEFAFT